MIKKYLQFINENIKPLKVQKDLNVKKYFNEYLMENFDDNCVEINDIEVDINTLNEIKSIFNSYYVLYSNELKQMWIKDKPKAIKLSNYFKGKYLYHDSRMEHRNSILKEGLKTNSIDGSPLGYENLLFFYDIDTYESYDPRDDKDVWILDVTEYKTQWYETPNVTFDEAEGVYCLMQSVPAQFLKLHK